MIGQASKMFCLFICPRGKMKLLNIGAFRFTFKIIILNLYVIQNCT